MTLSIGAIGAGAIGRDHIRRVTRTLPRPRVVAVADVNPAAASGVIAAQGRDAPARLADPRIVPQGTAKGVRTDAEISVNRARGHDLAREVVAETGAARPPEPSAAPPRGGARPPTALLADRKVRFVDGRGAELRDLIDAARAGAAAGPTARDGCAADVAADARVAAQNRPGAVPPITTPERPALHA